MLWDNDKMKSSISLPIYLCSISIWAPKSQPLELLNDFRETTDKKPINVLRLPPQTHYTYTYMQPHAVETRPWCLAGIGKQIRSATMEEIKLACLLAILYRPIKPDKFILYSVKKKEKKMDTITSCAIIITITGNACGQEMNEMLSSWLADQWLPVRIFPLQTIWCIEVARKARSSPFSFIHTIYICTAGQMDEEVAAFACLSYYHELRKPPAMH